MARSIISDKKDASKKDDSCKFCKIVRKETEAPIVFEDDAFMTFLDYRPLFAGHCLVVPKDHHETLLDLPADLVSGLFLRVQLITRAVEKALHAEGSLVAMNNRISQSVPHVHVHVVPRRKGDGLKGFFWPRNLYKNDAEMRNTQSALQSAIKGLLAPASTESGREIETR